MYLAELRQSKKESFRFVAIAELEPDFRLYLTSADEPDCTESSKLRALSQCIEELTWTTELRTSIKASKVPIFNDALIFIKS